MLPLALAPRLYLDTAPLIQLAEGRVAADVHANLMRVVRLSGAILILSDAHLVDLSRADDVSSNDRVYAAIDQFPRLALASSPTLKEMASLAPYLRKAAPDLGWSDLTLRPLASMQEYTVRSRDRIQRLRMATPLFARMSEAVAVAKAENDATSTLAPSLRRQIGSAHFAEALLHGTGESILPMLLARLREAGVQEEDAEKLLRPLSPLVSWLNSREATAAFIREQAIRHGMDLGAADAQVKSFYAWIGDGSVLDLAIDIMRREVSMYGGTPEGLERILRVDTKRARAPMSWASVPGGEALWHEVAPSVAPGAYLQAEVNRRRVLDRQSKPLDSDWTDNIHLAFVPYVDIATVDKANYPKLEPALTLINTKSGMRRDGRVLRNGAYPELLEAIRALY